MYELFKLEFCFSRVFMMVIKSVTVSCDMCSASRDSHAAQQYITHLFPCLHYPTSTWAEAAEPGNLEVILAYLSSGGLVPSHTPKQHLASAGVSTLLSNGQ